MSDLEERQKKDIKEYRKLQKAWSFLDYSYEIGTLDKETYNLLYDKVGRSFHVHGYIPDYLSSIYGNRTILSENYGKVIDLYDNHRFTVKSDAYDNKHMDEYLMEFFKYMNCHKLYQTLLDKDMVTIVDKVRDKNAGGYCSDCGRLSYVVLNFDDNIVYLYSSIAHEMGHALCNYVLSRNELHFHDQSLKNENISVFFEKLFFDFLMENSRVNKEVIRRQRSDTEKVYCRVLKDCKKALDAIDDPKANFSESSGYFRYTEDGIRHKNFYQYNNHCVGNLVSAKLLSENESDHKYFVKHLNDLIREFDEMSINELISQYVDFDAFNNRLDRVLIKK